MSRRHVPPDGPRRSNHGPNILYVAVRDCSYPRNSRLRSYLQQTQAASIDVLPLDGHPGYCRHLVQLLSRGLKARRIGRYDVVVLAELSVTYAPASWLLARLHRASHVVDFFVGLYETHVEDRRARHRFSPHALAYRLLDRFAITSADVLLTDTDARAKLWHKKGGQTIVLPVGAPAWARPQPMPERDGATKFLYYGNYIPLHGVPQALEAISLLRQNLPLKLTLVGDGDHRKLAERMVENLGLEEDVTFIDYVPQEQLAALIGRHHVVLGTFGTSLKATTVIANKVWQGLACGRPVVTGPSQGIDELLPLTAGRLFVSPSSNPPDIAHQMALAAKARLDDDQIDRDLESYVQIRYEKFGAHLRGL